jgi:hypothetical protein
MGSVTDRRVPNGISIIHIYCKEKIHCRAPSIFRDQIDTSSRIYELRRSLYFIYIFNYIEYIKCVYKSKNSRCKSRQKSSSSSCPRCFVTSVFMRNEQPTDVTPDSYRKPTYVRTDGRRQLIMMITIRTE